MSNRSNRRTFLKTSAAMAAWAARSGAAARSGPESGDWQWGHYGGDAGAGRYAPLDQINRSNVKDLRVAWTHACGDASERPQTTIETTPIVVDGVMYLLTPRLKLRALDAATGKVLWEFDHEGGQPSRRSAGISRAVCYWQSDDGSEKRILFPVRDQLYSVDAKTGKPDPRFGANGILDLTKDFDHDMTGLSLKLTSPPVVWRDLVILGGGGGDSPYPQAPGHIRGYDVRTGERRWIFHTVPRPGVFGYETWPEDAWKRVGGTNNWGGLSLDVERGLVFASIGSPAFDYWGGDRKGANLFGNCVLALDAATGERKWHYQTVHHDIWDYDLPCQPALVTIRRNGRTIDAVCQTTKQSFIFLLDRETGESLFPVDEVEVPPSNVPGEELWPTQPIPRKPLPLSRIAFTEDQITNISPEAHEAIRKVWESCNAGRIYTPTTLEGTFVHPGFRGGCLWGGPSHNPELNRLFINSDENTNHIRLEKAEADKPFKYFLPVRVKLKDPHGYPAIKPPWGYVTAIDLDSGDFVWRVVNGEYPELTEQGIPKTGTPSHSGSIATKGGLVFMGGTFDKKFRAFDADTGETLWEHTLKAGGFATPCSYEVDGKQYVAIAAGGGKGDTPSGDEYVVFALP